jgi:hypothetical protein
LPGRVLAALEPSLQPPVALPDPDQFPPDPGLLDDLHEPGSVAGPVLRHPLRQVSGEADVVTGVMQPGGEVDDVNVPG